MAKQEFGVASYVIGIVSIVFAFFQPIAAIILGIVGITLSKRHKSDLSDKGKKFSIIGIVIGIIILVATIVFISLTGNLASNFPIA